MCSGTARESDSGRSPLAAFDFASLVAGDRILVRRARMVFSSWAAASDRALRIWSSIDSGWMEFCSVGGAWGALAPFVRDDVRGWSGLLATRSPIASRHRESDRHRQRVRRRWAGCPPARSEGY